VVFSCFLKLLTCLQNESLGSEEDEVAHLTEEQKLQKRMDEQNMRIDLVMAGDRENFPIIGDIVRVKYTATLPDSGKIVMSTKNILERPWVEFVLGIDQVIKGFDRALPLMCIGERSRVTFTPEYGCKSFLSSCVLMIF
jgi:FKBP-type peptidyl-prolyl cis-trans isomerase